MEEARRGPLLKATFAAFENDMLKEHLWPQHAANSTLLKEAWSAYLEALCSIICCQPLLPSWIILWGWWWRYVLRTLNGFKHKPVSFAMLMLLSSDACQ